MSRLIAVAATVTTAAAVAVGAAAPARSTAGAASETLYYGKTSQGLGLSIPVKGTQIPRDSRAYLLYWIYKHIRYSVLEFHPGIYPGVPSFRGGRLTYHHLAKLPGGTIETWFEARLTQAGKVMTGIYRERDVGFSPVPRDSGTVRFTATAWASQQGREWAGSTADGKPLQATIRHRLEPGHVILNGKRVPEAKYTLSVRPATRVLTCQASDGTATRITASLPALSVELSGSDDLASSFSPRGGLSGSVSGSASAGAATVRADLTVKRLAWQGSGLAATGTLRYQGTSADEAGTATCASTSTTFTLRPR